MRMSCALGFSMPKLNLDWGAEGLASAIGRNDDIVIIDVLRFSSTITTAINFGFVIEPRASKDRKTESSTLSPLYFLDKPPSRVEVFSSNGAFLAVSATKARHVVFGSLLNAHAIGEHISGRDADVSLIAAGEIYDYRLPLLSDFEKDMAQGNKIFCIEDILGAGAISSFSTIEKSRECLKAERLFKMSQEMIGRILEDSASGKIDISRGRRADVVHCSKVNRYSVVPGLRLVGSVPEIIKLK